MLFIVSSCLIDIDFYDEVTSIKRVDGEALKSSMEFVRL